MASLLQLRGELAIDGTTSNLTAKGSLKKMAVKK